MAGTLKHLQLLPNELVQYEEQVTHVLGRYLKRLQWLLSGQSLLILIINFQKIRQQVAHLKPKRLQKKDFPQHFYHLTYLANCISPICLFALTFNSFKTVLSVHTRHFSKCTFFEVTKHKLSCAPL